MRGDNVVLGWSMNCPACDHTLTEILIGSVTIDICEDGCGGIRFDTHELQKVEAEWGDTPGKSVQICRDPASKADANRARFCPRCPGERLETRIPRLGSAIEFDVCPRCGGYWLDHGELETLLRKNRLFAPGKTGKRIHVNLEVIRFIHTVKIRKIPARAARLTTAGRKNSGRNRLSKASHRPRA